MFSEKDFIFWNEEIDNSKIEDELYPDSYLKTLNFIGPIKNFMMIRDPSKFPAKDNLQQINGKNAKTFPLVNGLSIGFLVNAVPEAVVKFLAHSYGCDFFIPIFKKDTT